MKRPVIIALACAMAAVSAAAAIQLGKRASARAPLSAAFPMGPEFDFVPPEPGSYTLHSIKPAPAGQVEDIDGKAQSLAELLDGKLTLVSFVYLTCSDVNGCPFALSTLFEIHARSAGIPWLRDHVQLMTISFDPQRDTTEAIASFAYPITHDPNAGSALRWHVLRTEDLQTLQPILDGFGQVVDRSDDSEKISHLLRMFLVDRRGNIRNIYGLGLIDPRLLMTDVESLLMEDGTL